MEKQKSIKSWIKMFNSLTNPDQIAENKRKAEAQKRQEAKKKDTGL